MSCSRPSSSWWRHWSLWRHPASCGEKVVRGAQGLESQGGVSLVNENGINAKPCNSLVQKKRSIFDHRAFLRHTLTNHSSLAPRYCHMHQMKCKLHSIMEAPKEMLRVHIAGITCKDFSVMNRHAQGLEGGKSGFPCLVWIFERRRVREQLLIIENV